jgi:hypothetical protein
MTGFVKKAGLGLVLGATLLTAAAPAEAQRYRHRDRNNGGAALAAGIAGLAIGAAIASSDRRYRDPRYDYDRRYYSQRGYYPNDGYYAREYRSRYRDHCTVRRVWDPYERRTVRVRYCR